MDAGRRQRRLRLCPSLRFLSGGDELINFPTLTLALGLPLGFTAGLDYTSNSEILGIDDTGINEKQYWLKRALPLGSSATIAGLVGYNSAAGSADAALDVRQEIGRLALLGELRGSSDLFGIGEAGAGGAIGAVT